MDKTGEALYAAGVQQSDTNDNMKKRTVQIKFLSSNN